ncbi:MAG: serine/threonine protein kinase, partial [Planctomycetes bacterium]|nr:serine/threonine protein kinase [Planctomycetota bacterium]
MPTEPTDEQLADLLEQMMAAAREGEADGAEAIMRENPRWQTELRELWATAQIADECASFSDAEFIDQEDPDSISPGENPTSIDAGRQGHAVPQEFTDYELLEEIGRGGMGVVFRARQKSLDRIVALKLILRGELATLTDRKRFRAEAEAAAGLNHPHVVPVYEVGEENGQPFFSMQYVEGTTLSRRIAEGPLPPREAAALLIPICRGIAEAHAAGLLHRDLKPSNILIDVEGRPFITDFGLAKRFTPDDASAIADDDQKTISAAITRSNAIVGTPGYMAPEQAAGRHGEVGTATDVYGLGALLYAMLTGRAPFLAASPVDTVLMVLEQDPLPPRLLNRKTDPDLEMIALKCLQKPADLRYASAAALADDLEAYLAGEPVSARSSRFAEVLSRAFRETHHAVILENWGLLWMVHSLVLLVLCVTTNIMQASGVESRLPYLGLWSVGLGCWSYIFWNLRRRSGPTTFVERQIAHIWAGSIISSTLLFGIEAVLDLTVLFLSPVIGVISGTVFLAKAGILSGRFYAQAIALFT